MLIIFAKESFQFIKDVLKMRLRQQINNPAAFCHLAAADRVKLTLMSQIMICRCQAEQLENHNELVLWVDVGSRERLWVKGVV